MPIRPSSAADVAELIHELSSGDPLQRETAAARLAVIGPRAVGRLAAVAGDRSAAAAARISALQALEAIGDPRALATGLALAGEPGGVGLAAIGVIGSVAQRRDARATRAFDWLAALALDRAAHESRRLSALDALEGSSPRHLKPVYAALAGDPSARMAARAARRSAGQLLSLDQAIERGVPDDPRVVAAMIRDEAGEVNVTGLRRLLEVLRAREGSSAPEDRAAWMAARGLLHQSLASRSSRLGLYDLRETLEGAKGPLPVGFLAAAAVIGDAGCLDPVAAAWMASPPNERWWRDHLAGTFRAIVRRSRMTRRHPVLKRILEKRPAAAVLVAEAKKA